MKIKLVGIVNVTPDSFSDGGTYNPLEQYKKLIDEGADIVEFGADSSRPGSICVGYEEEIKRLNFLNSDLNFGVDTHNQETAEFAVSKGATYINDISGTIKVGSTLIYMDVIPHQFNQEFNLDNLVERMKKLSNHCDVIDPGIGAFLSNNPEDSFYLLNNYEKILDLDKSVMLGVSRKGFLKKLGSNLDEIGLELTKEFINKYNHYENEVYLRVHNVAIYRDLK